MPTEYLGARVISRNNLLLVLIVLEALIAIVIFRAYGDASLTRVRELLGSEDSAQLSEEDLILERLERQINSQKTKLSDLRKARSTIEGQRINWPQLLDLFFSRTPESISDTSFRPSADSVTLSGRASKNADIFEYEDALSQSPCIAQISLERISAVPEGIDFSFTLDLQVGVDCG